MGQGNAAGIEIKATDTISFDGFASGAFSTVDEAAVGNAGGIRISTGSLSLTNGGEINASTDGQGNAGKIKINASNIVSFDGETSDAAVSGAFSQVNSEGEGKAGGIEITADSLSFTDGGQVSASTLGQGDAGKIDIKASDTISFDGEASDGFASGAFSTVDTSAEGNAGGIRISTGSLSLTNGAKIDSSTFGQGNAAGIEINATDTISFDGEASDGFASGAFSTVDEAAVGDSGGIKISTGSLSLTNGGAISAKTFGQGDAGRININATDTISFDGEASDAAVSGAFSEVNPEGEGNAGGIRIFTGSLSLTNGGEVSASTFGKGNAGGIEIKATDAIFFDGENSNGFASGAFSQVNPEGEGKAEGIEITTSSLFLTNGGLVSASTLGQGDAGELEIKTNSLNLENNGLIVSGSTTNFNAGDITLNVADSIQATNSFISTSSIQSSGGNLTIAAGDIQLRGDSDITTNILSGKGSGGNIDIKADSVIAFDDSDIFASAPEGQGGNINLNTPAFFAENFTLNSLTTENTDILRDNNRADVNATGRESGTVSIPDVSFIQNSLTELENNSINTDELVANSCVSPVGDRQQGKFIITGGQSLPVRPGDGIPSKYPTGEVRNVPESNHSSWQPGDPIVEPQGAYRLADGKLVLSRQCSQ